MPPTLESTWLTVDEAVARGLDAIEIMISSWGAINGAFAAPQSRAIGFPFAGSRGLPAPSAIAIGPRSYVDRAWIVYDLQKTVVPVSTDYARRLSLGSPVSFFQPSQQTLIPSGIGGNAIPALTGDTSIFISPLAGSQEYYGAVDFSLSDGFYGTCYNEDITTALYYKADGSTAAFGQIWAGGGVDQQRFTPPVLDLIWYLRPPAFLPAPRRFPLQLNYVPAFTIYTTPQPGPGEALVAEIPTFGRKRIAITINAATVGAVAYDVRIGAIPQIFPDKQAATQHMQEATVATAVAVASGKPARLVVDPLLADYVMVYIDPHAAGGGTFSMWVTATDD